MNRPTSFRIHIRRLFTDRDVEQMKTVNRMDLSRYEDVKRSADQIIDRLESIDPARLMPPPPPRGTGPWPAEWIALFKRWQSEGYPE